MVARCRWCQGAVSTLLFANSGGAEYGHISRELKFTDGTGSLNVDWHLVKCAGCGSGALVAIYETKTHRGVKTDVLVHPDVEERVTVSSAVPNGVLAEFDEAQGCSDHGHHRAAMTMLRSALEKALIDSGYVKGKLFHQLQAARDDGVITAARLNRVDENVRGLGNDVVHDPYRRITAMEYRTARDYLVFLLHDLYDDRESVEEILREKGRLPRLAEPALDEPSAT